MDPALVAAAGTLAVLLLAGAGGALLSIWLSKGKVLPLLPSYRSDKDIKRLERERDAEIKSARQAAERLASHEDAWKGKEPERGALALIEKMREDVQTARDRAAAIQKDLDDFHRVGFNRRVFLFVAVGGVFGLAFGSLVNLPALPSPVPGWDLGRTVASALVGAAWPQVWANLRSSKINAIVAEENLQTAKTAREGMKAAQGELEAVKKRLATAVQNQAGDPDKLTDLVAEPARHAEQAADRIAQQGRELDEAIAQREEATRRYAKRV